MAIVSIPANPWNRVANVWLRKAVLVSMPENCETTQK